MRQSAALVACALVSACGRGAPAAPAAPAPVAAATPVTWATNAQAYRAQAGQVITVMCPPGGAPATVWGTDTYSDDSSICTAALHSGRITAAAGGIVSIQIMPGMPSYAATMRNGVTTQPWGSWVGSFSIVGGPAPGLVAQPVGAAAPAAAVPGAPVPANWGTDGADVVQTGQTAVVGCPPNGTPGSVWGTDIYTNDSSVCTAAVHAGVIQMAMGGVVRVTGLPGMPAYAGSPRNGVTTSNYGQWSGSFRVEPANAIPGAAPTPSGKPL